MSAFPDFSGNEAAASTLAQMSASGRIPQTILLTGPEGIGKATLARRFAAGLLGDAAKIEQDDLSLPANIEIVEGREKWTSEKRAEEPLMMGTHPDFATFPPDGPLRQISIQQMRLLKERAQFSPVKGQRRVFLIDHLDQANEQAANSLLKLLEEPPPYLVLIGTVQRLYDLLPTIRSRSVILEMNRLTPEEIRSFAEAKGLDRVDERVALSEGSPGLAATLDIEQYKQRREVMLALFECGAGIVPFGSWVQRSESFGNRKTEKLDLYLKLAYGVLEDLLLTWHGLPPVRNQDISKQLTAIAGRVNMRWIEQAVGQIDRLNIMVRRNIQKMIALDAIVMTLRNLSDRSYA